MNQIIYRQGDATNPVGDGVKIIAHICNDVGGWGAGFVLALSKRWKEPEKQYLKWVAEKIETPFKLGEIDLVAVEKDLYVANMIAQRDISTDPESGEPPIRYNALSKCLAQLSHRARKLDASIHIPRIGCGLAGGKWEMIEPLINEHLINHDISVTVYDFN